MTKRRVIYGTLSIVALSAFLWLLSGTGDESLEYVPAIVERGTVLHTVSVTGHAEPEERIRLSFPVGGRITALPVEEGSEVLGGTVIGVLDGGIENAALREVEARVAREQALLNDVTAPLRDEERAVKVAAVTNAERTLERAESSAWAAIARAFTYADDAVHEEADELFSNTQGGDPRFGVSFTYGTTNYRLQADSATEIIINEKRALVETVLTQLYSRSQQTGIPVEQALEATENDLAVVYDFLVDVAGAVNRYIADDYTNQTVYETFQTSVATARTAVDIARSEIATAHDTYVAALASLSLAERNLELSEAGVSKDAIAAQKASLAVALAAVGTAEEKAQDTVLSVPFGGTLSKLMYEVGEMVSPYEPVAELITEGVSLVEAFIPEADIARIRLGDKAEVTFDAFDKDTVYEAEVFRIAVSETVREGVPTYKTMLRITGGGDEEQPIRPGMTADIEIYTDRRENILYVPVRSVLRDGSRTYVRVYEDGALREQGITVGLRGSEGTIEVVSGLREGQEIVLYTEEA